MPGVNKGQRTFSVRSNTERKVCLTTVNTERRKGRQFQAITGKSDTNFQVESYIEKKKEVSTEKCGSVKIHKTKCTIAQNSVPILWLDVMQDQYGTAMRKKWVPGASVCYCSRDCHFEDAN